MNRVLSSLAACALCAAFVNATHAATEVWQSPLSASLSAASGDVGFSYPVPLFDRQGGARVLTGVQIAGSVTMTARTNVLNTDVPPVDFGVRYDAGVSGTLPGGVFSAFQTGQRTVLALMPGSFSDIEFVLTADVLGAAGDIAAFSALHGGSVFAQGTFTGALTLPALSQLVWSPAQLQMGGAVTITYTYQLVPAPASGLALLTGGAVLTRRRRR